MTRTVCACRACSVCCEHVPGVLIPSDVGELARALGYADAERFASDSLCVSEGATMAVSDGRVVSLPTLVPRSRADGSCVFYRQGRCAVHRVSPFGCAYFDAHMDDAEHQRRTAHGYGLIWADREAGGPYAALVDRLRRAGQMARSLVDRQRGLARAMQRSGLVPPGPKA
jgi:Fe-S-cluster containining protein